MDFTAVAGGIIQQADEITGLGNESVAMSDEDLTMEFTNVLGGVLHNLSAGQRESVQPNNTDENATMDMTAAVGDILPPIEEHTEPVADSGDEETSAIDMTKATGQILQSPLRPIDRTAANHLMEMETNVEQMDGLAAGTAAGLMSSLKSQVSKAQHTKSITSETGSPSLTSMPRLSGRNKSTGQSESTTPKSSARPSPTSVRHSTPTKQVTPLPTRSQTPNKTPVSVNITQRGASPKKLFKAELEARASPAAKKSPGRVRNAVFDIDEKTGHYTPSVILHAPKPQQHLRWRSSGIGIDKDGIGSPRVAEILSRRASIGVAAPAVVPQSPESRMLQFADPKVMERELEADHSRETRRESERFAMEQEADEQQEENVTLQLREMIESMMPKRTNAGKLKGRKSLAIGAARGVLGKRPAELDIDDEDDGNSTPGRLKAVSREASLVKRIHLPKPPSKSETTGRLTRTTRQSLGEADAALNSTPEKLRSPNKRAMVASPQHTGHFKELHSGESTVRPLSFEDMLDNVVDAVDISTAQIGSNQQTCNEEEKISLQEFLNMTNIHFIELSTTKWRHTIAPDGPSRPSQDGAETSLESCFSTAATTLPLLELYQHATRELKSYISNGRKIIRTIEAETLAEQPALFREYVDARPDVRMVMDNQFRNAKSYARLQSREGWYAWRGQLVEGLRGVLEGIKQGMQDDAKQLNRQDETLSSVLPQLSQHYAKLEQQMADLERAADEFEAVDRGTLLKSRSHMKRVDDECSQKLALLQALQEQIRDKDDALSAAEELKMEMRDQIVEAERVREECRGWATKDVLALKAKVEAIEKETGWSLITAEEATDEPNEFGVALTMMYKDVLRLFFYPAAYQATSGCRRSGQRSRSNSGPTAPISLTFSPKKTDDGATGSDLSTEERFFLQLIQSQLHSFSMMPRGSLTAKTLLKTVATGWDMAGKVSEEIRMLNMTGIATVSILSDETLGAKLMLMIDGNSRVDLDFALAVSPEADGSVRSTTSVNAIAVYGSIKDILTRPKSKKVRHALDKEVESKDIGTGAWINAVRGFERWAQAQNSKQRASEPAVAPQPSVNASVPTLPSEKRSPLSIKKTNAVQKKSIPILRPRLEKVQALTRQREEKENILPPCDRSRGSRPLC
jgi:kinetochore protein Spc7/SPC105